MRGAHVGVDPLGDAWDNEMKIGDRVRYIGENWPDRKGWEGTVLDASSAECATVRFDLLPSAFIRVYYSSLELTKMKPAS